MGVRACVVAALLLSRWARAERRRGARSGGGRRSEPSFEHRLRAAEARLKRLPNSRSYLACGGDHCVLPQHRFYTLRVAGVRFRDWPAGRNVSCPTCRGR